MMEAPLEDEVPTSIIIILSCIEDDFGGLLSVRDVDIIVFT